jgi:hypothetical protein
VLAAFGITLVAPVFVDADNWWPRRFIAALLLAPVLAIISGYIVQIGTPGFLISAWLGLGIYDPSWALLLATWIVIDCSLWFVFVWGVDSLLRNLLRPEPKKLSWHLIRASAFALAPSLYACTGYASFHLSLGSSFLLPCLLSFLFLLGVTSVFLGIAIKVWPASWRREVDSNADKLTTLNLR